MTHLAAIAGIAYASETEMFDIDDSEFSDIEIPTTWVPPDTPIDALKVRGPENVWAWVDIERPHVWLPELPAVMRGWQLRQITPAVSACFERLVIHASASIIGDHVVAFVGESDVGKSSLAWELQKAGHRLVSDDVLPVRFDPKPFVPTHSGAIPLHMVCFLSRGSKELTVDDVTGVSAIDGLARNGFGEHEDPDLWAFQFDGYHQLAASVRHVNLAIPDDRDRLPDVAHQLADLVSQESQESRS